MKELRKKVGLTQGDMAEKLGVNRVQYLRYESGESGIDLVLAEKIAAALGVPVMGLMDSGLEDETAEVVAWLRLAPADLVHTLRGIILPVIQAHPSMRRKR